MKYFWAGLALLMIASPSLAAPIYLTCEIVQSDRSFPIEVTLDEANQQATIFIPSTGNRVRRAAQFTADKVIVPDGDMMSYEFNRIDGSVIRRMPILDNQIADRGTCKVTTPPKDRAF